MKPLTRIIIFLLAATSIWCLLGEMYHLWPMGLFALAVFLPASAVLVAFAIHNWLRGDGRACRMIVIGAIAGFAAALSYDTFRLPFVFSASWGLTGIVPALPLFKVFTQFGTMILGNADSRSLTAGVVGWAYHFSNGITFGIMYAALVNGQWRRWPVAIVFAVGLELGMLFTPYPAAFGIRLTETFFVVTMAAHLIFGIVMGWVSIVLGRSFGNDLVNTGLQPGCREHKETPAASAALSSEDKPLKRLPTQAHDLTGLKPGANEKRKQSPEC